MSSFKKIYKDNKLEGVSKEVSPSSNTTEYVKFIESFLKENDIKTVVDVGCGDWQFSKLINWGDIFYIGYDIVSSLIQKNINKYSTPNIKFIYYSGNPEELHSADLLICKDILQNLSNNDIFNFIQIFQKYKYCLITHEINPTKNTVNTEIESASGRYIDLSKHPFNLECKEVFSFQQNARNPKWGIKTLQIIHKKSELMQKQAPPKPSSLFNSALENSHQTLDASTLNILPKLPELPLERTINFKSTQSWCIKDEAKFNALLSEALTLVSPGYYLGDNLFTWCRNNSLFEDTPFYESYKKNITNTADQAIAWRRYILACSAYHCIQLEGDFVECGVYIGTGIKTIMDYLGGPDFPKTYWGYDTFDYNPVEGHAFEGQSKGFYEKVKKRFIDYKQVNLIKGFIPDSFSQGCPKKIALLHIDLNNAEGELAVLEHLFDKVVPGGMIILDDYEWAGVYRPQKKAEDPWFQERGYRIFPLPTGQGLVLKR